MIRYEARGKIDQTPLGDLPGWLSSVLRVRGINTPDKADRFLNPSLCDLHDPFLMQDMNKAVVLIREALASGQPVVVYGDYDVDGICAASIMTEYLRELGGNVSFRVPDRHEEGYGLHEAAIREIAEKASLLITVDCGITNHEEVLLAQSLGMKVIVTDHHQPAETPSPADAVLDPLLGDYPFRRLCGAGVALKVCQALGGMAAILPRLDLAALATVADIVPLVDENRVIVREGLAMMTDSHRPGLRALIDVSELSTPITAGKVGFQLAPRLNAGGRLENATQGVELMLTHEPGIALAMASHLNDVNTERRQTEEEMLREAERMLPSCVDFRSDRVLVLAGENWNKGVIGLVAGKLCERFHYPTIVLSVMGEEATGSCRSIPGVNIHAMLSACKDLFTRFGGHEQAAGLTLPTERIPELRRRLSLVIDEHCDPACYVPVQEYDLPLDLAETSLDLVSDLEKLQPFGFGNPAPLFLARDCDVQSASRMGKTRTHLRTELLQGSALRRGVGFSMGDVADQGWSRVDLVYSPELNEYNGNISLQLMLKSISPASGSQSVPSREAVFDRLLQELHLLATKELSNRDPVPSINRSGVINRLKKVRGTLVLTHRPETALFLAEETGVEVTAFRNKDARGFSCILCGPDISLLEDLWDEIILADGDLIPGEAEAILARCPNAVLSAAPVSSELKNLLEALNMSDDLLRKIYISVRAGCRPITDISTETGLTFDQIKTALLIFRDTGLVTLDETRWIFDPVLPARKCSMTDSPLVRRFRRLD